MHTTWRYLNRQPVATLTFTDGVPPSFIAFIKYVPVRDAQPLPISCTEGHPKGILVLADAFQLMFRSIQHVSLV